MGKVKLSFLLLGLGIGIILTNFIYSVSPKVEYRDLTEEEIVDRAKELGMVYIKDTIEVNSPKEIPEDNNIPVETEQEIETEIEIEPENIVFKIKNGEALETIAKNLYNAGLIDDINEFINYAKEKGLSKSLRVGTYNLNSDMDYETLVMILTKKNN